MSLVLVSGFDPFDGDDINPSLEIARSLDGRRIADAELRLLHLPVERFRAVDIMIKRLSDVRPAAVIMLGLRGRATRLAVERLAVNIDDYRIPDNAGDQPSGESIVEGAPAAYFSTLPLQAIKEAVTAANIPITISNSAGTFLCNRIFYAVMHHTATQGGPRAAGFIHLPYFHEQVADKEPSVASLSRADAEKGVLIAIETTLAYLKQ